MNHAVIGAAVPFLIGMLIYFCRRAHAGLAFLVTLPLLMAAGAFWAVLPDLPLLIGKPEWYFGLHRGPWINIFFWHGHIDRIEKQVEFAPWNLVVMGFMLAVIMAAAWRELHRLEVTIQEFRSRDSGSGSFGVRECTPALFSAKCTSPGKGGSDGPASPKAMQGKLPQSKAAASQPGNRKNISR